MFNLDKLVFEWFYDTCIGIGSTLGLGFIGGAFCIFLLLAYSYTLANKGGK